MKILISLWIPVLSFQCDVWVMNHTPIGILIPLLKVAIENVSKEYSILPDYPQLYSKRGDILLDPSKTLKDYNIGTGEELFLI